MKPQGFTLIELLVVLAVTAILSTGLTITINPLEQIKKGRDAQRKNDLSLTQRALELYYQDYRTYPPSVCDKIDGKEWGTSWSPYMDPLPKDPSTQPYVYQSDRASYKLYAKLENCSDPQIISPNNCDTYNYLVSPNQTPSPFTPSPPCIPEATPTPPPLPTPTSTPPTPQPIACRSTDPIQFVGWAANPIGGNFSDTFPINKPTGTQEADVMIAHIYSAIPSTMESPPPPGWNLIREIDIPAPPTNDTSFVFSKVAGPSEPTSYSWDLTDGDRGVSGAIATYRNVNNLSPIHASAGTSGSGTTYAAPSLTTTINNTMLLALFGANSDGFSSWTHPSGMTERYDYDAPDHVLISIDFSDQLLTTAGPTGAKTATISLEDAGFPVAGVAYSIALASCVPSPPPVASGCADGITGQDFGTAGGKKVHGCNGVVSYADAGTLCSAGWHMGDAVRDVGLNTVIGKTVPNIDRWFYLDGDPGNLLGYTSTGPSSADFCWGTQSPCSLPFPTSTFCRPVHAGANHRLFLNGTFILSPHFSCYHKDNPEPTGLRRTRGAICVEN